MNNKPFLLAGSIALGVIALTLVFMAGRMSSGESRFNWHDDSRGMMNNDFRGDMGNRFDRGNFSERGNRSMDREMEFIDESALSAEQKTQLDQIKESQQEKTQELMQSFRTGSGISQTEIESQIEAIRKSNMIEIRQFVAQDQLDKFDAFVAEGKPNIPMFGKGGRGMW